MDVDAYRDLQLLTEISSDEAVTQRSLAKRYRLALGLTNFLISRLVKKGYVKLVNLQRRRLRYLITPQGMAEKARLTYEYLEYSLSFYRQIRTFLSRTLAVIIQSDQKDVVLYGTGEMAEVAFLTLQQHGVRVIAILNEEPDRPAIFMRQPVRNLQEIPTLSYDWVVIALPKDSAGVIEQLSRHGVPGDRILAIQDHPYTPGQAEAVRQATFDAPLASTEVRA